MFEIAFSICATIATVSTQPAANAAAPPVQQDSLRNFVKPLVEIDPRFGQLNSTMPWTNSSGVNLVEMEWGETWKKLAGEKEKIKREAEDEHKKLMKERKAREKRSKKSDER